jgi:hypothetical protein
MKDPFPPLTIESFEKTCTKDKYFVLSCPNHLVERYVMCIWYVQKKMLLNVLPKVLIYIFIIHKLLEIKF